MKPTCLTPGCVLPFDHTVAHSKTETEPYAGFADSAIRTATASAIPLGEPTRFYERPQYTNLPPRPVTLEGLAAVISACGMSIHALGNDGPNRDAAGGHLLALIAKAREVACGKEQEMTAGDAVRSVHQRIAAMPEDELERRVEAIAARDADALKAATIDHSVGYAAGYNRAVIDAANVLPDVYGAGNEDVQAVKVQHGIMALHKAGVGEMRMAVTQVDE